MRATVGRHAVGVHECDDERCATTANPALRAPAGPTLAASPTKRAPWRSATSLVAPASADASSTTTQARARSSAPSSRSSCTGRSRTGTTTVTSPGPNVPPPGRGRMRRPRRAGVPTVGLPGPTRRQCPPSSARRAGGPAWKSGTDGVGCPRAAPSRRRTPASTASCARANEPGSGVEDPGRRRAQRRGRPGHAGLGHRPILAVRGRG